MRYYAKYEKSNDIEGIKKLNGLFMIIFTILSTICIICGIVLCSNLKLIFKTGLTAEEYPKAKTLLMILVISMAVSLLSTVFSCYETAHEKFLFQSLLEVLNNLLNPFITLPLLLLGKGSVAMVAVSASLIFCKFIANVIFCFYKLHIRFNFKHPDFRLLKDMSIFTFYIFLNQIIDQINWNLDKVLLGRFCSTIEIAIYGVASNIYLMFLGLLTPISNVFIPKVNRLVVKNKERETSDLFTSIGRIQFMLAALLLSGYIFFGKSFIILWAGKDYKHSFYIGLVLIIPGLMELIQHIGIEIQRARNMHKTRSVVYFIISLINIIISIPLIIKFGAMGAAIGTAIALVLGNWIFMNYYYHTRLHIDIIMFWKNIFKILPSLILPILCGIVISKNIDTSNWVNLIISIAIYSSVYLLSVYIIAMNSYERTTVKNVIRRFVKHK